MRALPEPLVRAGWLLQFAALNLSRHVRRTTVAVLTIAVGFCALALFSGYTMNVYRGMHDQAIYGEMLGHLTLYKPGLREQGRLHPERWVLKPEEIALAQAAVKRADAQAQVFPRLALNGLISNGRVSTIFVAEGVGPQDMRVLRGPQSEASGALEPDQPHGISVSRGLAALLEVKAGDDVSLLGSTVRGQANALDATVVDTFDTGNLSTNDMRLYVPIEMARSLLDAPGSADRLTVLLTDVQHVDETAPRIEAELRRAGLLLTVQTWRDEALAYRQVKAMFDLIFAFMFAIVLAICVMALINVVGMNIIERVREIGALRALGMRRATVVHLFTAEALLMVLGGCLAGLLLTLLLRGGINGAELGFTPPNSTDRVPLTVGIDLARMGLITLFLGSCGALSAGTAARRAARRSIVDALGHV